MAATRYAFTGGAEMHYMDYRDTETDQMLTAEPGGTYSIASVDPDRFSVPPNDGRWVEAVVTAAPPVQPVVTPAPAPAPAPQGGGN